MTNAQMPDFTGEQRLGVENGDVRAWKSLLGPILIMPIVLLLLAWFLLAALFNMLNVPAGGPLGLLGAVVIVGVVLYIRVRIVQKSYRNSWVTFSPSGIEMRQGDLVRQVAWGDFTSVGVVVPTRGIETNRGGSSARVGQAIGAGVNRTVQALSGSIGLLGRGTFTSASGGIAAQIVQVNRDSWGIDPATGQPLVGIAPAEILEKDWMSGPGGAWVRRFRPDLAAELERQAPGQPPQAPGVG